MVSPSAEIHKLELTGVHPKFRFFDQERDRSSRSAVRRGGGISCSHAGGTLLAMSGFWAIFLIHPPMTLEERNKSGSSQEFGETSAKVASGARLAVVPPVMTYRVQYLRFWMVAAGIPMMSDPYWVAVFSKLVVSVCLPRQPNRTCAIIWAVPATCPVRLRWVVTLLRGP
eukprot:6002175-Heterocapsa_arctica.AAC.1